MNYQNSSKKNKDLIIEASNEEPCILKTDVLCMFSGSTSNGQQFDNVLIHVDEEVRLLEEMAGIENNFEHVFSNFENNGIDREIVIIKEVEDKQMRCCDDNQNEASSVENQDRSIKENVKECMIMLTDTEVQEFCDFKIYYFYESVNHEEALEK